MWYLITNHGKSVSNQFLNIINLVNNLKKYNYLYI